MEENFEEHLCKLVQIYIHLCDVTTSGLHSEGDLFLRTSENIENDVWCQFHTRLKSEKGTPH